MSAPSRLGLAACVFHSVEMLSVARHAGFDFLMLDMEHGHATLEEACHLSIAGIESGFEVQVRVPHPHGETLTRAVDCGIAVLVVPHVDSAEDARSIVARARFAPVGNRPIPGPVPVTGFRPVTVSDLVACSEAHLSISVIIESAQALAEVDAIASVNGIDTLMVGTNDLAAALGHAGQPQHEDVEAAFRTVAAAAHANGKRFAVIGLPENLIDSHVLATGAHELIVTNEINLLFDAATQCASRVRSATDHAVKGLPL